MGVRKQMSPVLFGLLIILAACGSTATASETAAVEPDSEAVTEEEAVEEETAEQEAESTQEPEPEPEPVADPEPEPEPEAEPEVDAEPPLEQTTVRTRPAGTTMFDVLGGIELQLAEQLNTFEGASCIALEPAGYSGTSPFPPRMNLGEVLLSGGTDPMPITTVADFLAIYAGQPTPVATGETLTVLGEEFTHYRVEGAFPDGPPPDSSWLHCASSVDARADFWFVPAVISDVYISEAGEGLRMLTATGFNEEDQQLARDLFDDVLPTIAASS